MLRPLVLALALMTSLAALAKPSYTVTAIGNLPGTEGGMATAINNHNQVVGWSQAGNQVHAFLWSAQSGMQDLNVWGLQKMYAWDINDAGVVVGEYQQQGQIFGYRQLSSWDPYAHFRWNLEGFDQSRGRAINLQGQVVGYSGTPLNQPVLWSAQNAGQLLPGAPHGGGAADINNAGAIAGTRYFGGSSRATVWSPGLVPLDLTSMLPPLLSSGATSINDSGWASGVYQELGGRMRSFVFLPEVGMQLVDPLEDPSLPSQLHAISAQGIAVGQINWQRAAVWQLGVGLQDLNSLIDPGAGWVLNNAYAINDAGYIVGTGTFNGFSTNVLLSPVPEPATALTLGAGLLLLMRRRTTT